MHAMILCSSFRFFSIRVDLWVSMIKLIAFWGFCMILVKFSAFTDAAMWYSCLWCSLRISVALLKFLSAELNTGSVICRKQHTVFAKTFIFWFAVNKPWVCGLPRSLKWPHFIVKLCFRENISPPKSAECISLRQFEIEWMSYSSEVWTSLRCLNSLHC